MRDFDAILADAAEKVPFSNGSESEIWEARWCNRCKLDAPFRNNDWSDSCPLISISVLGYTPKEWIAAADRVEACGRHECTEFVPDDEGGGGSSDPEPDPEPVGELDGQVDIFAAFAEQITEQVPQREAVSA